MTGSDDVDELLADALAGLHGVEREQQVHAEEPGRETDGHEQADLDRRDRNADSTGALLVTADGENPVAERVLNNT